MYTFYPSRIPAIGSQEYVSQALNGTAYASGGLGRSGLQQGGYQMAALALTLAMAVVGGAITGLVMRMPLFSQIKESDALFEDEAGWLMPSSSSSEHDDEHSVKKAAVAETRLNDLHMERQTLSAHKHMDV